MRVLSAMGSSPAAPAQTDDPAGGPPQTTPPAGDPPKTETAPKDNGEGAVEKAYAKLRTAESELKDLRKENSEIKPENANLKEENDQLRKQNGELQGDLTRYAAERLAGTKGFVDPEAAVAVLMTRGVDLSDKNKAEKALDAYAQEKTGAVGETPPSGGPVNPQTQQTPAGNAGMNSIIRRAGGRGA